MENKRGKVAVAVAALHFDVAVAVAALHLKDCSGSGSAATI